MTSERPYWARGLSEPDFELCLRGYFSVTAAAGYLNTSERWICSRIRSGELHAVRVGRRYRIKKLELDRIIDGEMR